MNDHQQAFCGAKLMLCHAGLLLVYLRDDLPGLPFPAYWDLPGGGREGDETPLDCARRELFEEFGLDLPPERLRGRAFPSFAAPGMSSWLFAGSLDADEIAAIRFGPEGQEWRMMPVEDYLSHSRAIPHFCRWMAVMRA
ncbi:MAG: NUDIX hydrolase [Paracoccus sp. (in: a-proteobacteria)]